MRESGRHFLRENKRVERRNFLRQELPFGSFFLLAVRASSCMRPARDKQQRCMVPVLVQREKKALEKRRKNR